MGRGKVPQSEAVTKGGGGFGGGGGGAVAGTEKDIRLQDSSLGTDPTFLQGLAPP